MMAERFIKNIDFEQALALSSLVDYQPGQVVSRTLAQNRHLSLTLFAFDEGEQISSHASTGDAMVYCIDGAANITIGENDHALEAGQTIVMPAGIPHALTATGRFKMLLIVVFKA